MSRPTRPHGDSGGAVFGHVIRGPASFACTPYCALGIVVGGIGAAWDSTAGDQWEGICKDGVMCDIVYSSLDKAKAWLGLGPLNPKTVP